MGYKPIFWKAWAPGKTKMFSWLLHQDCLWCNDRLHRQGWVNGYFSPLCMRNLESSVRLFWTCNFGVSIWNQAALWKGYSALCMEEGGADRTTTETISVIIKPHCAYCKKGYTIHDHSHLLGDMARAEQLHF